MRFAFISDELPRADLAGHGAVNQAIIVWLRELGHEVDLLLLRPRLHGLVARYAAARVAGIGLRQMRGIVFVSAPSAALGIAARRLRAALPRPAAAWLGRRFRRRRYAGADAVIGAFPTPAQSDWCAARIGARPPDAVLIDTLFRAPLLRQPALAGLRSVIIAHDLFHQRHRALRGAGYAVFPAELTREDEAGLLGLAGAIAAIQPEEAAEFRLLCPASPVCVAPMPALPCPPAKEIRRIAGRLVFVGSATLPNLDGLRWFLAEIWPALLAADPRVTLDLVGDCGAALPHLPAGVRRLGRIPVLAPVLHRASLAISPLRLGSGLKIKILDYARHGLLTVATGCALRGFAADANAPFLAADDEAGFADAVAAGLKRDPAPGAAAALAYVARHYDPRGSFRELAAALGLPEIPAGR